MLSSVIDRARQKANELPEKLNFGNEHIQAMFEQFMLSFRGMGEATYAQCAERVSGLVSSAVESLNFGMNLSEGLDLGSSELFEIRSTDKFLDRYSVKDLEELTRKSPLNKLMCDMGYEDWFVQIDLSDQFNHHMQIRTPKFPDPDMFLAFLIVRRDVYAFGESKHTPEMMRFLAENFPSIDTFKALDIRWLALQNPGKEFTRARLPGQKYPGTGLGRVFSDGMIAEARKYEVDALSNTPEHFHNAYLYDGFFFADPSHEARFRQMKTDLAFEIEERGLAAVSFAIDLGALRCDDKPALWVAGEHLRPLSLRAKYYFSSFAYTDYISEEMCEMHHFTMDWDSVNQLVEAAVTGN